MIFNYQKLIKDNNLSEIDLPDSVKIGIKSIKGKERIINMKEKSGKNITDNQLSSIKREDDIVCRDIKEYIESKSDNSNKEKKENENEDPRGVKINREIAALIKEGKTTVTIDELKSSAPTTYSVIFEAYEKDGIENGVETGFYKCVETPEKEKFTLSKIK